MCGVGNIVEAVVAGTVVAEIYSALEPPAALLALLLLALFARLLLAGVVLVGGYVVGFVEFAD